MATRSSISIVSERTENGKGKTIYSHWDGYPSHNGRILLEHYQDPKKIKALNNQGFCIANFIFSDNQGGVFEVDLKGFLS